MPTKLLTAAVLICLLVWHIDVIAQQPNQPEIQEPKKASKQEVKEPAIPPTDSVRIVADESRVEEEREHPTEYYEQGDLKIQSAMADATKSQAFFARNLFYLTIFEVLALIAVLVATLKANKSGKSAVLEAARANQLATDANSLTKKSFEVENRAWVCVHNFNTGVISDQHDKIRGCNIDASIRNTGVTPALNVRYSAKEIETKKNDVIPQQEMSFGPSVTIGPSMDLLLYPMFIPLEKCDQAVKGEIDIYIFYVIEYNDVFTNEPRVTTMCNQLNFDPAAGSGEIALRNKQMNIIGTPWNNSMT